MNKKKNILSSIFACVLAYKLFKKISDRKSDLDYLCTLYIKDRSISFKGYLDTGNLIRSISGDSVVIVHSEIINKILSKNLSFTIEDYNDYLYIYNNLTDDIKNSLSYTFYKTTNNKNILPILKFDKLVISNKRLKKVIYNPYIGILDIDFTGGLIPIKIIK